MNTDNKITEPIDIPKRGRGRPKKDAVESKGIEAVVETPKPADGKNKGGRPRKYPPKDPDAPKRPKGRPKFHTEESLRECRRVNAKKLYDADPVKAREDRRARLYTIKGVEVQPKSDRGRKPTLW